ncbi:MAG: hypothetical protein WCE54_20540 [Ignavibacteriaceae bacterium]
MKKIILLSVLIALSNISCSVYQTIVNISRLQFKLGAVNNFTLNGVSLSGKTKIQDFSATDILKISAAVARGSLPVSFVLNVDAKNPNDGTGGYKSTNATIKDFPWRLLVDDKETISGDLASPVTVPGTGQLVTIPLRMNFDLASFFKDKNYESLINLALNIGGNNKTSSGSSNLALYAKPVVTSVIGDISYPQEIKIIGAEFTK